MLHQKTIAISSGNLETNLGILFTSHIKSIQKQSRLAGLQGTVFTAQKLKLFIKNIFSKCDQIHRFRRIWEHLQNKPLIRNFICFSSVCYLDCIAIDTSNAKVNAQSICMIERNLQFLYKMD